MTSRREFIAGGLAATAGLLSTRLPNVIASCQQPPPNAKVAKSSYIRLYDEAKSVPDDTTLARLAQRMTSMEVPPSGSSIPPGYTYLGQFIDHDLTWNDIPFDAPKEEQVKAPNFRSPFLDLDSVYGNGPPLDCQYEGPAGEERFVIGKTTPSPGLGLKGGSLRDVPFEDGNRPVIGDRMDLRNAENLILRQLHVVFLKFHNQVIGRLPERIKDHDPSVPPGATLFARAQKLVRWTYQWLVWNDFVPKFRPQSIEQQKLEKVLTKQAFYLPLEFVLAGFRFGHSMVQGNYALNCHHKFKDDTAENTSVDLKSLINPSKETAERLAEENAIDWRQFFAGSGVPIFASKIDTHINPALGELPSGTFRAFAKPGGRGEANQSLPYRTLVRGARACLASGQQVASQLRKKAQTIPDISGDLEKDEYLKEAKLTENTPLWYYILKEAEVRSPEVDALGPLGYHLIEDTIAAVLQNDSDSFVFQGNDWKPPRWILPEGSQSMSALIEFAQANEPVEGCADAKARDAASRRD